MPQFKFFTVEINQIEEREEEINGFLRGVKLVDINRELINKQGKVYWCICIEYLLSKSTVSNSTKSSTVNKRIEETEERIKSLTSEETIVFDKFRLIRKEMAKEMEIPAYGIIANKELVDFIKSKNLTIAGMMQVEGINKGRIKKFGEEFLKRYHEASQK